MVTPAAVMQPGLFSQAVLFSPCDRVLVTGSKGRIAVGLRLEACARRLRSGLVSCEAPCSGLVDVLQIIANLLWLASLARWYLRCLLLDFLDGISNEMVLLLGRMDSRSSSNSHNLHKTAQTY